MSNLGGLIGGQYDIGPCETKQCYSPTPLSRLKERKLKLEQELSATNDALQALEENPNITKVLELIARALS